MHPDPTTQYITQKPPQSLLGLPVILLRHTTTSSHPIVPSPPMPATLAARTLSSNKQQVNLWQSIQDRAFQITAHAAAAPPLYPRQLNRGLTINTRTQPLHGITMSPSVCLGLFVCQPDTAILKTYPQDSWLRSSPVPSHVLFPPHPCDPIRGCSASLTVILLLHMLIIIRGWGMCPRIKQFIHLNTETTENQQPVNPQAYRVMTDVE